MKVIKEFISKYGHLCIVTNVKTMGHFCGYIGVREGHFLYGKSYDEEIQELLPFFDNVINSHLGKRSIMTVLRPNLVASMDVIFDVHGGITFSGYFSSMMGFTSDLWFIGFDCAHAGDSPLVQNADYVEQECEVFSKQLYEVEEFVAEKIK